MAKEKSIVKVFRKLNKYELTTDFKFWKAQPFELRLATLEKIRKEYHNDNKQRFSRICKITKRA